MTNEETTWAEIIGPCYTTSSMARALGWTEDEVFRAGDSLHLLALTTSDGTVLYPAFRLEDGLPVAGLRDVLLVLQTGTTGRWTWAQWLNTPLDSKDPPRAAIDALRAGHLDDVLLEARRDAWSWSS